MVWEWNFNIISTKGIDHVKHIDLLLWNGVVLFVVYVWLGVEFFNGTSQQPESVEQELKNCVCSNRSSIWMLNFQTIKSAKVRTPVITCVSNVCRIQIISMWPFVSLKWVSISILVLFRFKIQSKWNGKDFLLTKTKAKNTKSNNNSIHTKSDWAGLWTQVYRLAFL